MYVEAEKSHNRESVVGAVCVYVCISLCVYLCMCVSVCVSVCVYIAVCVYVCWGHRGPCTPLIPVLRGDVTCT